MAPTSSSVRLRPRLRPNQRLKLTLSLLPPTLLVSTPTPLVSMALTTWSLLLTPTEPQLFTAMWPRLLSPPLLSRRLSPPQLSPIPESTTPLWCTHPGDTLSLSVKLRPRLRLTLIMVVLTSSSMVSTPTPVSTTVSPIGPPHHLHPGPSNCPSLLHPRAQACRQDSGPNHCWQHLQLRTPGLQHSLHQA